MVSVDRLTPYVCRNTQRLPDYEEDEDVTPASADSAQYPMPSEEDDDTNLLPITVSSTETVFERISKQNKDAVSPPRNEQSLAKRRARRKRRKRRSKNAEAHQRTESNWPEGAPVNEQAIKLPVSTRPKRQSKTLVRLQNFVLNGDVSTDDAQPAVCSVRTTFEADTSSLDAQKKTATARLAYHL